MTLGRIGRAFEKADFIVGQRMEGDAFKTQYYIEHGNRVSELAEKMAEENQADPRVCKMAGKFHDIGYSPDRELEKDQHIAESVRITHDVLEGLGFATDYVDRVVSCVETHDNRVLKTSPIENKVVNDADVLVFFDSLEENIALFVNGWNSTPEQAINALRTYSEIKAKYIQLDRYKPEIAAKKKLILKRIQELSSKGMEAVQDVADRKYTEFVGQYQQR